MTYNPSIPRPPDIPANSQAQFLSNFELLNQYFGIDHVPFGNAVTAATLADPCQLTSPNHGLSTGNTVTLGNFKGISPEFMISPWSVNGNTYTITVIDANDFTLNGVDTTSFLPYLSGSGAYSSSSIPYGQHIQNTFPMVQGTSPGFTAPSGAYYTKSVDGTSQASVYPEGTTNLAQLFFTNGPPLTATKQLTSATLTATTAGRGFTTPWGFIVNLGQLWVTSNGQNFTFPVPYTNMNSVAVITTTTVLVSTNPNFTGSAVASLSTFNVFSNIIPQAINYIAIGY